MNYINKGAFIIDEGGMGEKLGGPEIFPDEKGDRNSGKPNPGGTWH